MIKDYQQYKNRHLAFWSLENVDHPLVGFTLGAGLDSWSYWQYNRATQTLFKRSVILPENINVNDFVEDQLKYMEQAEKINDDVIRSAMPLASIPWMEAMLGCSVISAGSHLKGKEFLDEPALLNFVEITSENPWAKKYIEFVNVYKNKFEGRYPVGQSILRGPSDIASAMLGAENATISLLDSPEAMYNLLDYITNQLEYFLKLQLKCLPKFEDGYVIGQYEIWAPEPAIRIQEDFSTLYSPSLYDEYLKPLDFRLAGISEYTLIHLHSSSLFLIDNIMNVEPIRAFQITKDPGVLKLDKMIPPLQKIQQAGKPLIIKGQFDKYDIDLMKQHLKLNGLCIQPVVKNLSEANELLPLLRSWN